MAEKIYLLNPNGYIAKFVHWQNSLMSKLFGNSVPEPLLTLIEASVWVALLLLIDIILQRIFKVVFKNLLRFKKLKWSAAFYKHKVFRTLLHLIPVYIISVINPYVFEDYEGVEKLLTKLISMLIVLIFITLAFRIVDAITDHEDEQEDYSSVAVRAFGQLIKVFAATFGALAFLAILINTQLTQILTVLGALMAVILLIFKDPILGFVSGLQIAASKSIKVGDWIAVSKYNLEGTVKEINLVLTKIQKFDKTISTIPTYDLVSTEITNYAHMSATNTRRIKRAIVFNVNSFKFIDKEMLEELKKIDLITEYLETKEKDLNYINKEVKNPDKVINGRQLTNIGVFRIYAENYLKSREDISQTDTLVVRQLALTHVGMPLEVYCFAASSFFSRFEEIQADVFDHLISAGKEFGLEVSQPFVINK